jgi:hypothetical protein
MPNPAPTSPFKFLDAYGAQDGKNFFGREVEIEALYTLVVKSRLVLVYGPSGSGKTSLIQCGLANRFKPTDWFPVFVRRGEDLNASLQQRINALATTPIDPEDDIVAAARSLYLDYYRPLYFIFDQFEELFILGDADEEAKFFASVQALLASDLNAKIIISMREEYIALLQNFEAVVPTLFDSRQRVEQMTLGTVEEVIMGMTAAAGITLEHGADTARRIIAQIGDRRAGVQLAYLQVYLDKLYRDAQKSPTPMLFTDALVDRTGKLGDVMADFLEEQTQTIADTIRSRHPTLPKGSVHRVLEALTTVEGTKVPMAYGELAAKPSLRDVAPMLDDLLAGLEQSRIIRRDDDIIEVSHDQLAKRIAERRSVDSKALMRVEKLVRDRLAGNEQTKTYLAAEELAVVQPVLSQLTLSPAEAAFVAESRSRIRWRRLRVAGSTGVLIAVLAGFGVYASVQSNRAFSAISAASETTNSLASTIVDRLRGIAGTDDVQREMLSQLKDLNGQLEFLDSDATTDAGFWLALLEGDIAFDADEYADARGKFRTALADADTRRAAGDADGIWQRNMSVALNRLASLESASGNAKAASEYGGRAVTITEAIARTAGNDAFAQHDVMLSHGNMAGYARELGDLKQARIHVETALKIARRIEGQAADDPQWQRDHAYYLQELGRIELADGDFAKARTALADAVTRFRTLADTEPANFDWRRDEMWGNYYLAEVERRAGRWPQAAAASGQAMAALGMTGGDEENHLPMLELQRSAIAARDSNVTATQSGAE